MELDLTNPMDKNMEIWNNLTDEEKAQVELENHDLWAFMKAASDMPELFMP